jgi:hypothetical protein
LISAGGEITWIRNVSRWLSPLLNRTSATISYGLAETISGSENRTGIRLCSPVFTVNVSVTGADPGKPNEIVLWQLTVVLELLITTSCFSTVSPGKKTWSLLVNWSGFPAR